MPRRTRTRTTLVTVPRAAAPIIRVSAPRAAKPKRRHRRRSGASSGVGTNELMRVAVGSAVFGYLEKSGIADKLPTVPAIGRKGTLAVASYFAAKHFHSPLLRDVCVAATALAAYEFSKDGKISGDEDDFPTE